MGLAGDQEVPSDWRDVMRWRTVPGGPRPALTSLASTLPLVGARHRTRNYLRTLRDVLGSADWDVVIVDQYGMGWVVDELRRHCPNRPAIVFITHDHEASVTRQLYERSTGNMARRLFLQMNHLKARHIERRTAMRADLLTTITDEDAEVFRAEPRGGPVVSLRPGYSGPRLAARTIGPDMPNRALIFGSFHWSAKQENLSALLELADPYCGRHGIELVVAGAMPANFAKQISARYRNTRLFGFVDDPTTLFQSARLAIVAEPIGGGFKMKIPELVFHRVPLTCLSACRMGLPSDLLPHMFIHDTLPGLIDGLAGALADTDRLDRMQNEAYETASSAFDWAVRGRQLRDAIADALRRTSLSADGAAGRSEFGARATGQAKVKSSA
ncbi:hypothetical protein [Skermanella sp. TT6]